MQIKPILRRYIKDGLEDFAESQSGDFLRVCKSMDRQTYFSKIYEDGHVDYLKELLVAQNSGLDFIKARLQAVKVSGFKPSYV